MKTCDLCDKSDRCKNNQSSIIKRFPPASLRDKNIPKCYSCKHTITTMASLGKKYCVDCKKEWKLNESIGGK